MKIAIQGGQASFHHTATLKYFGEEEDITLVECQTFRELCKTLTNKEADLAVMAIENTLVGSILPNYSLLKEYPVHIIGETYLHIEQNLIALPGQHISDIRFVRSHPMALLQCSDFLEDHPHMLPEETIDTAISAREIAKNQSSGIAAIASRLAAKLYDLEVLKGGIENLHHNYTRFLVLSAQPNINNLDANKASLNFHVSHEVGALSQALSIFVEHKLNLSLIQSIALPMHPHKYAFHVDLEWNHRELFDTAISKIKALSRELHILGIYKKGERPYDNYSQSA